MALSYTQWQGDGVTQSFPISFQYIAKEHVSAVVNLNPVAFTWDDDNTIRITPAPANGAVVEARRTTPRAERLVDFSDGSTLTESDLDLAQIQTFYIVQEAIDIAGGTLELLSDGSYGAGGRRIKHVGTPVDFGDAVPKWWAEQAMSSQLAQAIQARSDVEWVRDNQVHPARDLAIQARVDTQWYLNNQVIPARDQSTASAAAALVSKNDAAASQGYAWNYKEQALVYRNETEAFKNSAAASASAAATFNPASYVPKAGGTFTGSLVINRSWPGVTLQKTSNGEASQLVGATAGGKLRWVVMMGNQALETGGNAGSDFSVERYTDNGDWIGSALYVSRSTGRVDLSARPTWAGYTPWDSNNFSPASKAEAYATVNDIRFTAGSWLDCPVGAYADYTAGGSAMVYGITTDSGLVKGLWFRRMQALRNGTWFEVGTL